MSANSILLKDLFASTEEHMHSVEEWGSGSGVQKGSGTHSILVNIVLVNRKEV